MAHRVAELLDTAASARSKVKRKEAEEAATDLVLRLWERRAKWPQGWPPEGVARVIQRVQRADSFARKREQPSGSPWLDTYWKLEELSAHERELWLDAALLDLDASQEKQALEKYANDLKHEERETLEWFLERRHWAETSILKLVGKSKDVKPIEAPIERAKVVAEELRKLGKEREELTTMVLENVRSGTARERSPKRSRAGKKPSSPAKRRIQGKRARARPT
jgi:hypothetical protein